MAYILIIGAKSDIAKEIAKAYAKDGYNLYLAGRKIVEFEGFQKDVSIRTRRDIQLKELDIANYEVHKEFFNVLEPKPEGVIVVAGFMAKQEDAQNSQSLTLNTINVNYTGCVSFLNEVANYYESQKKGFIVGVSSVAGDRGRATNYIYGSAKAGFSAYLSGLRNRLCKSDVHVLTVKPGFVDTKMTEDLDLPDKLTASPKEVAKDILQAQKKRKNILYTKSVWAIIMLIIKHIPEAIFKKLSI